jgi:PAS domain S-box-containing protein
LDPDDEKSRARGDALKPVFVNAALRQHQKLFDVVLGVDVSAEGVSSSRASAYLEFRSWVNSVTKHDDSKDIFPLYLEFSELLWTGSTVRRRWRVISGNMLWKQNVPSRGLASGGPVEIAAGQARSQTRPRTEQSEGTNAPSDRASLIRSESTSNVGLTLASSKQASRLDFSKTSKTSLESSSGNSSGSKPSITLATPEKACTDWTAAEPRGILTEHMKFARSVDWAATPLGPMRTWSRELRQIVNLAINNPHPVSVLWGNELTMIYNEAYVTEVAGNKHPSLMGYGFAGEFSELWEGVRPLMEEMARTGLSVRRENDYLPIERFGLLEETFFSWSWTPLYGGTDNILGFYNAPFETTQMERHRRMMQTINRLGECTSRAKSVKQYWRRVLEGLDENVWDVPFALLYSVGEADDQDHSSISSGSTISLKSCYLEGSIAVPEGHPAAPHQLDLKRSLEGFIPSFREAMRTREPTLLNNRDGSLPLSLLDGVEWRGFGEPCREAVIFPVRPTNGDQVLAFLLVGMNPRRPYDESYQSFVQLLNRALATSLASTLLFEEEVRRSRDAAETAVLEQEKLSQQLALQTDRMRRMTELSPLGMFLVTPQGVMREANDRFYEMTGLAKDDLEPMSWMSFVDEGSVPTMEHGWAQLVEDHVPWSSEVRLSRTAPRMLTPDGEVMETWVLFTGAPEFAADSSLRSILGSITDISHLKWAEGAQNRRLAESIEEKRQQNEFIDITSHEMRNPLSAILQCADDIYSALDEYVVQDLPPSKKAVENCIDAAKTISLCVQHQKNIVDDILTISKLDSNLLLITPTPAQPLEVLQRSVKMVDPELQAKDIQLVFQTDDSYKELDVDWITLDPSRVRQVLINLLTNAIKFTAESERRVITVAVGASKELPDEPVVPGFQLVPTSKRKIDNVTETEDTEEELYIHYRVQDTGVGLTTEEKQTLFARFKQATARTHVQYGGSGLGLFICKQLCELHGGSIGVASEAGVGSTFGFYVKARRSHLPTAPNLFNRSGSEQLTNLTYPVAPLRQDLAGHGPAASLLAKKALTTPSFNPAALHILVVEDNLMLVAAPVL